MATINKIFSIMNFKKFSPFIIIILFLTLVGFFLTNYSNSLKKKEVNDIKYVKIAGNSIEYIKIGGVTLKVELATTPKEQEQGLSGRIGLGENEGMLFIFPEPSLNYFWMKDMNFPIDMIWIGEDQKIIYIKKNVLPESFPKTYGPQKNSKYILEVNANFCEKNNLRVGDNVEFLSF